MRDVNKVVQGLPREQNHRKCHWPDTDLCRSVIVGTHADSNSERDSATLGSKVPNETRYALCSSYTIVALLENSVVMEIASSHLYANEV